MFEPNPDDQLFAEGLSETLKNISYSGHFINPEKPDGAKGQPVNEEEWKAVDELWKSKDPNAVMEFRPNDVAEYHYYQPVYAKESCVGCHRRYGFKGQAGDVMSIVKVVIPDEETQRKLAFNRAFLWSTAIIIVFLAMVAAFVIVPAMWWPSRS